MTDDTPTTPADRATTSMNGASPAGWGAAPTPTATSTLDVPAPPAPGWPQAGPSGATPWYGPDAPANRSAGPKPPWFWPVVAVAVGLAALLVGGGVGFAVGHAIGGAAHSTVQVPGTDGGTDRFPGGGTGPDSSGSAPNS